MSRAGILIPLALLLSTSLPAQQQPAQPQPQAGRADSTAASQAKRAQAARVAGRGLKSSPATVAVSMPKGHGRGRRAPSR